MDGIHKVAIHPQVMPWVAGVHQSQLGLVICLSGWFLPICSWISVYGGYPYSHMNILYFVHVPSLWLVSEQEDPKYKGPILDLGPGRGNRLVVSCWDHK